MRLLFVLVAFVAYSWGLPIDIPDLPLPVKIPKIDIPHLKDINPGKIVDLFGKFKGNFGKKYKNDQDHAKAMAKFGDNLKRIAGLNDRQAKKGGAKFGMNKFADLTDEEFTQQILMREPAEPQSFADYERSNDTYIRRSKFQEDSLDWRDTPYAVGPIRDQSSCGCCWAFTAASVIQSVYGIKNKKTIQPSEQQLCDCGMMDPTTPGCNGGSAATGLQYAVKTGVSLESFYTAYTPSRATKANVCDDKNKPNTIKIKSATQIYPADDYEMADALSTYGPLAAAFKVGSSFRFYESGIFYDDDCDTPATYLGGHAISVVGYGSEDDVPYWIVKNSWGSGWGEDGFVRFARGYDLCTIESRRVVYAVPL